jgi:long-chain acyl-CoA synthetase
LDHHLRTASYIPNTVKTINFGYHADLVTDHTWSEILKCKPLKTIILPEADELYTIMYSSGTSGTPKGVMFTHGAIAHYLSIFADDLGRMSRAEHFNLLSYLPLAHVYERSAIELASLSIACDVSFVENLDTFALNLQTVHPTLFTAVPRIWSVFKHKLESKISPIVLSVILHIPGLSYLLRRKVRHGLGLDKCTHLFSGSSHLPQSVYNFFDQLKLPIQEGYGQTENLGYATVSLLNNRKYGYVGTPRLDVEVKLGSDQEILMRSPCLMKGYYNEPIATAAAFTEDGWLHTGDLGEIDEQNRVKVLSRISEYFKNQKGEFINPVFIEKKFSEEKFIDHICLVGRELESNVLLISLNEGQTIAQAKLREQLQKILHAVNSKLESYEKIAHIGVVKEKWSQENNLLTPTLKVKRRQVETRYQDFIREITEQHMTIVFE